MHRHPEEFMNIQRELAALPTLKPAEDAWPTIRSRLGQRQTPVRGVAAWGLAAALALGIGAWIFALGERPVPPSESLPAAPWIARSQVLESLLHDLDTRGRVLSGAQAQTVAALQGRIALLDLQLAAGIPDDAQAGALWRHRAELMAQLLEVKMDQFKSLSSIDYII